MEKRSIVACPKCGNPRITAFSIREGGVPGASEVSGLFFCRKCGRRVMPVVFKSEIEYGRFLKELGASP